MKLLRLALIGAGNRCTALYKADLKKRSDVEIVAVCDTCSEKSEKLICFGSGDRFTVIVIAVIILLGHFTAITRNLTAKHAEGKQYCRESLMHIVFPPLILHAGRRHGLQNIIL